MARILVVDDQDMMRDSLAATLAREGHEVVAAGDGPTAVARLTSGAGQTLAFPRRAWERGVRKSFSLHNRSS